MGLRYDGNDSVAPPETWCPRARVHRTDQDCVALVVPSGANIEALCNVVRMGTADVAGPVSAIDTSGDARAQRWWLACGGCQDEVRLIAALSPLWPLSRPSEELALGA